MDSDFKPARRPAKSLRNTDAPEIKTQNLETFETPEEVAAKDSLLTLDKLEEKVSSGKEPMGNKSFLQKIKEFRLSWPPGKKEWAGSLIIILVCGTLTALILNRAEPTPVSHANKIIKKEV